MVRLCTVMGGSDFVVNRYASSSASAEPNEFSTSLIPVQYANLNIISASDLPLTSEAVQPLHAAL